MIDESAGARRGIYYNKGSNKNYAQIIEQDSESNDEKDLLSNRITNSKPSNRKDQLHSSTEVSLPHTFNSKIEPNNRYIKIPKGYHRVAKYRFKVSFKTQSTQDWMGIGKSLLILLLFII